MPLIFHAGGTPTLPSIAALKGARASCPPEPGRLRHLIALGAPTSASARKVARAVKADEDVGVPRGKPFACNKLTRNKKKERASKSQWHWPSRLCYGGKKAAIHCFDLKCAGEDPPTPEASAYAKATADKTARQAPIRPALAVPQFPASTPLFPSLAP